MNNGLLGDFKSDGIFTFSDIMGYLRGKFPALQKDTLKWHLHELKRKGEIQHVSRGLYTRSVKSEFNGTVSPEMGSIFGEIAVKFPFADSCIWHTSWLNEFMELQQFHNYTVIETEKDTAEALFHFLSGRYQQVFIEPDHNLFEKYISGSSNSIIVKAMVSESPTQVADGIKIPTLEKLLVDCLADKVLFAGQQDFMDDIFRNAFAKYSVNTSRMKRYASRRNKQADISDLIQTYGK